MKFYQLPNSKLFTHRLLFFSRESTSETYGPQVSFSYYLPLQSTFHLPLFLDLLNQKCIAAFYYYLFYLVFDLSIYYNFISRPFAIWGAATRNGLTTLFTRRVVSSCYLCVGVVYVVLLGSPTGSITLVSSLREIPTIAVLHHPFLFGEIAT